MSTVKLTRDEHRERAALMLAVADERAARTDPDAGQAELIALARAQLHATLALSAPVKARTGRVAAGDA